MLSGLSFTSINPAYQSKAPLYNRMYLPSRLTYCETAFFRASTTKPLPSFFNKMQLAREPASSSNTFSARL